jgi:hypothetical protein
VETGGVAVRTQFVERFDVETECPGEGLNGL